MHNISNIMIKESSNNIDTQKQSNHKHKKQSHRKNKVIEKTKSSKKQSHRKNKNKYCGKTEYLAGEIGSTGPTGQSGSFIQVGSSQVRAQTVTSFSAGTPVVLTSVSVLGSIIVSADATSAGTFFTFPTATNLISAGGSIGSIFPVYLSAGVKIGITTPASLGCTIVGGASASSGLSFRTVLVYITSATTYTLYV